ncbi:MAG: SDR family oxidoreductase [bacterium]
MDLTPTTKVLVTGASGSLGWTLSGMLAAKCRVSGTYLTRPQLPDGVAGVRLDLAGGASIAELVTSLEPDVIVHAAAITDPDRCERDIGVALAVNFEATGRLASAASRLGSRLVYVSTDLVFDGAKGNYRESDQPRPLSVYGTSKLRGEEVALEACPDALVIRSALIYGLAGPARGTFLGRMLDNLAEGRRVQLFTDQRRNPVLVDDLAAGVVMAIRRDLAGLYHLGGSEAASRYQFGKAACEVFECDQALLVPVTMDDAVFPAKRPADATLDIGKFVAATGLAPCGLLEGLRRARAGGSAPDR